MGGVSWQVQQVDVVVVAGVLECISLVANIAI